MIYRTNWQKVADEADERQSQELMLTKKLSSAITFKQQNSNNSTPLQEFTPRNFSTPSQDDNKEGGDEYFYFETNDRK